MFTPLNRRVKQFLVSATGDVIEWFFIQISARYRYGSSASKVGGIYISMSMASGCWYGLLTDECQV